jgi:hypothetical protein
MQGSRLEICLKVVVLTAATGSLAYGQAVPTAIAGVHLSAFGGVTGDYIGVGLSRNLSVTAGFDATFRPYFLKLFPSLEVRGTYPVDKGSVAGEKNIVAGPVFSRHFGRVQPYGDILFGRGEINYVTPLPNPTLTTVYVQTVTNVISPGGGCNVVLSNHFAIKGDFQFQRYDTPVTDSGSAYAKAITGAVVYKFGSGGLWTRRR